ncbi:uncharacterized protein LOC6559782 [Drosophila grimshawi]|uniref:GH20887 n=1 Tax=Drosophila grimshawi TaxID=7222 RepID=B4J541_DROGR|nr:uncharacterized protein LOC6559782 [Drosophila grimshawi]EDW00667.1 GH20887 [Drosophila grimshawi]
MCSLYIIILLLCASHAREFIEDVVQESMASLIVIRYDYCEELWLDRILAEPPLPVVLQSLDSDTTTSKNFSRVLQLVCLPNVGYQLKLTTWLENVRGANSIFYIMETVSSFASSKELLQLLLRQCYKLRMLSVLALIPEDSDRYYYRYQPYPQFELEQRSLNQKPFFVAHLRNMQGQPLIVLPQQKHPRLIVYKDWRTGALVLNGSVGRFVRTLAWKLNASIEFPTQVNFDLHYTELVKLVEQHHIDVPAALTPLTKTAQLPHICYPFELSHICLMIPIAQQLPIKDIYVIICSAQNVLIALIIFYSFGLLMSTHSYLAGESISWVDFVLNDVALRGLLGQSFGRSLHTTLFFSWIYVMLAHFGMNVNSIHGAALGTLLTHLPKHFQPRTFADVRRLQLPLVMDEADGLHEVNLHKLTFNTSVFNSQRDTMNTSNVYLASRLKWTLLSEQQKYFPHEVFLYSKDACISHLTHMVFQLPKNTWFQEPITNLIMDARDFGLFQYWVGMHFYDMAAAGLLSFKDPIERVPQRVKGALRLEDLQWIWIFIGALLLLATSVFALEILIKRLQHWLLPV